jgi:hypothetical protein
MLPQRMAQPIAFFAKAGALTSSRENEHHHFKSSDVLDGSQSRDTQAPTPSKSGYFCFRLQDFSRRIDETVVDLSRPDRIGPSHLTTSVDSGWVGIQGVRGAQCGEVPCRVADEAV